MTEEEVQSNLLTTEKWNFFHISSILVDDGTQCLRQIFDRKVGELSAWLEQNRDMLLLKKRENNLYDYEREKLYPRDAVGNPPSSTNFDLTLLVKLLKMILDGPAESNLRGTLDNLRKKRNCLYAHVPSCCMETKAYESELRELYKILVDELPSYGFDPPNDDHWRRESVMPSYTEVARLRKKLRQLTENDQHVMLVLAEHLTKNAKAENTSWSLEKSEKLKDLCKKVEVHVEASRRGEDMENLLGASVGQLVDAIADISGVKYLQSQLLFGLNNEQVIGVLDQHHQDLREEIRDVKKTVVEALDSFKHDQLQMGMQRTVGCCDENDTTKTKEPTSFKEAFDGNNLWLIEYLDIGHGLLPVLKDKGLLTKLQIDEINHKMNTHQQSVEALIKILETKSVEHFKTFCECLDRTNQRHVAKKLREPAMASEEH